MPYKHKNGCTCMTMPEFLAKEGQRVGKSGGQVLSEIMDDMDSDDRRQEEYFKTHPDNMLDEILKCYDNEADQPLPPKPVAVLEVLDIRFDSKMRANSSLAFLKVEFDNEETRTVRYATSHWDGSFYDPPEEDYEVDWNWKGEIPVR